MHTIRVLFLLTVTSAVTWLMPLRVESDSSLHNIVQPHQSVVSNRFSVAEIQMNHGLESFFPARRDFLLGHHPVTARCVDFDGDLTMDLAEIQGFQNGRLLILHGTESADFEIVSTLDCGSTPRDLAVMDLNMDDLPDVLVAASGDGLLRTFTQDASGQFAPDQILDAGASPSLLSVVDANGDGTENLILVSVDELFLFSRRPEGGLFEQVHYSLPDTVKGLEAADFIEDGRVDLLISFAHRGTYLYPGSPGLNLGPGKPLDLEGVVDLESEDLDLDGHRDIVAICEDSDRFAILYGDGTGEFRRSSASHAGFSPSSLLLAPLDSLGILDIVAASKETGAIQIYEGSICGHRLPFRVPVNQARSGNSGFPSLNAYCFSANEDPYRCGEGTVWSQVCDFDRDGLTDLLALNQDSGTLSLFFGAGGGTFHTAPNFAAGPGEARSKSVAVFDANHDGHDDVALVFIDEDSVSILFGDGNGNLTFHGKFPTGGDGHHTLDVGDLNEDGNEDIVVRNGLSSSVSVLLGDGTGDYSFLGDFATGDGTHLVSITDLDLDGHLDVITPNSRAGTITILLGDGTGMLSRLADIPVGLGPHSCVPFFLDSDSLPDLATANMGEDSIAILKNDAGFLTLVGKVGVGNGPISITSGDFNEDGISDLATADFEGFTLSILLGTGQGDFAVPEEILAGRGPHYVITEDLDGDGHTDLVSPITGQDAVMVLYGDGSGHFPEREYYGVGNNPNTVASGDFNEDDRIDIVSANTQAHDATILYGAGMRAAFTTHSLETLP